MRAFEAELAALAAHLRQRRGAILEAWRLAVRKDPTLTSGDALPREHLNDHIPGVLAAFERQLDRTSAADSGGNAVAESDAAAAHGLHRWQQGYDLREVIRELGKLNECMVVELENHARANAGLDHEVMATARRAWATTCSTGIEESTAQFFRLQQMEAAGNLADLERALDEVRELEQQRAALWWQVAHDLRGNVGVVANATEGLASSEIPASTRESLLRILERNVNSLHHLLDDVTSLARLQAGHETRQTTRCDVSALLREFCEGLVPFARQRNLYLHSEGPDSCVVEVDWNKTRRVAQNLVLNAIKFTRQGGVTVSWGNSDHDDGKRWALVVEDTGPGFDAGPGAPLAGALEEATKLTQDGDSAPATTTGQSVPPAPAVGLAQQPAPGEGIGLSIVKRLCELLDATVEVESGARGTTFRVLLPRRYQ